MSDTCKSSFTVLLVDDDEIIRDLMANNLQQAGYQVDVASCGKQALEMLNSGLYRLVISDWVMPNMSGVELCGEIRARNYPRYIYVIVVTSRNTTEDVVAALDAGADDFIAKPVKPAELCGRLRVGERVLALEDRDLAMLSKTLSGSISVLTEILSLVNPATFGNTASIRGLVRQICQMINAPNAWEIEIAAMLSQIGCITLPETTMEKLATAIELSAEEQKAFAGHPQVGHDLLARIPRLSGVAKIVACQQLKFSGGSAENSRKKGEQIPLGSRILKIVIDAVQLISYGIPTEAVLGVLRDRKGWYDPDLIAVMADVLQTEYVVRSVTIDQLEEGMVLVEHVMNMHGDILVARGQDVTASMRERLTKFAETSRGVREPLRVRHPMRSHYPYESFNLSHDAFFDGAELMP